MSTNTNAAPAWELPDRETAYYLEEGSTMTLGEMLEGVTADLIPTDQSMLDDLLTAYGAWESPELARIAAALA